MSDKTSSVTASLGHLSGVRFPSRRSMVQGRRGAVATSQPLAAQAGLRILMAGGNAFDAAVATAAALNVVEPMSTGIGGDAFALCCPAGDSAVYGLNASGRAPLAAKAADYRKRFNTMPQVGIHSVTVPGAVDGFATLLDRFGTMTLKQVLQPAIEYAEDGFPVSEIIAKSWKGSDAHIRSHPDTAANYLSDGHTPRSGDIFRQPNLARSLEIIADGGRDAFYLGEIAEKIVAFSQREGGLFTMEDFARHTTTWDETIHVNYRGYDLYEIPPNGQGIVGLMALNILKGFDIGPLGFGSTEQLHLAIESLKLAFADGYRYIGDPRSVSVPIEGMISEAYADERRKLIDRTRANKATAGLPPHSDTIYLTTADGQGNVCSFINSLYGGFGSGLVAGDTGITLQNRGGCFVLEEGHPNCLDGGRRPYHTIIPAMALKDGKPFLSYGVMGGFMQPQGHLQVLSNIVDFGMNPQEALDAPRFRIQVEQGWQVMVERTHDAAALAGLRKLGHDLIETEPFTLSYGGGQAIMIHPDNGALIAATDPRKDGSAVAF